MTKEEALTYLEMWIKQDTNLLNNGQMDTQENIDIYNVAIECIKHCIDEENTIYEHVCSSCGYTWSDKYEVVSEICPRCDKMMDGSDK